MIDIESGPVQGMSDASAAGLLEEMRTKRQRGRLTGWAVVIAVGCALLSLNGGDSPAQATVVLALGSGMVWYAHQRDLLRKTTVVFYEFEDGSENMFRRLHDAFESVAASQRTWHVESQAAVRDTKYHAGAGTSVRRTPTGPVLGQPPGIKLNIDVPLLKVGRQLLAFMPERILVFDGQEVGAVPYAELVVEVSQVRFIESSTVPTDSEVVGHTWQYVNKKGGPDRRFSNNRELPICIYEELHFKSHSGIDELIQLSRTGYGDSLASAIHHLGNGRRSPAT